MAFSENHGIVKFSLARNATSGTLSIEQNRFYPESVVCIRGVPIASGEGILAAIAPTSRILHRLKLLETADIRAMDEILTLSTPNPDAMFPDSSIVQKLSGATLPFRHALNLVTQILNFTSKEQNRPTELPIDTWDGSMSIHFFYPRYPTSVPKEDLTLVSQLVSLLSSPEIPPAYAIGRWLNMNQGCEKHMSLVSRFLVGALTAVRAGPLVVDQFPDTIFLQLPDEVGGWWFAIRGLLPEQMRLLYQNLKVGHQGGFLLGELPLPLAQFAMQLHGLSDPAAYDSCLQNMAKFLISCPKTVQDGFKQIFRPVVGGLAPGTDEFDILVITPPSRITDPLSVIAKDAPPPIKAFLDALGNEITSTGGISNPNRVKYALNQCPSPFLESLNGIVMDQPGQPPIQDFIIALRGATTPTGEISDPDRVKETLSQCPPHFLESLNSIVSELTVGSRQRGPRALRFAPVPGPRKTQRRASMGSIAPMSSTPG
ncbi:MAG: hypothetical protein LBJ92_01115 [Holosporales bacterium]|jgi:hypothetical protein|nr:hypothetical protein [Holosporales bacterium]